MSDAFILRIDEQEALERGGGIRSIPLSGARTGALAFCNGITEFPPGASIELHTHNTEESVVLLAGDAECEVEGERHRIKPFDTTYIPAGVPHRFLNVGETWMKIMWIYGSLDVKRTLIASGKTLEQFERYD